MRYKNGADETNPSIAVCDGNSLREPLNCRRAPEQQPQSTGQLVCSRNYALIKMLLSRTLVAGLLSLPLTVCAVAQDAYVDREMSD